MSNVIDESGGIIDEQILAAYQRIAGPRKADGRSRQWERVDSAEAFLQLVLRFEERGQIELIKSMIGDWQ